MPVKFYDTCALLNLQDKAFEEKFYISSVTLQEIENFKYDKKYDYEIKSKAKKVAKLLEKNEDKYDVVVTDSSIIYKLDNEYYVPHINDNIICAAADTVNHNPDDIIFVSDDLNCRMTARKVFGLETQESCADERIYKGYKYLTGSTDDINEEMAMPDFINEFATNEYLIITNTDTGAISEMRFNGDQFVALKLPPSKYIKGKNSLQRCALDALLNNDITTVAILGKPGSGKTYMSTKMALYHVNERGNQSTIELVREPTGEGQDVGFIPGTFDEKTEMFFEPFVQHLDGGEFEMESLIQQGKLEATIPRYMKGLSLNNTILWVDEAEDLTEKQIKLIGTRVGDNSKIFFSGDYKQSLVTTSDQNALVKMCNLLRGNSKFACIYLDEDVRSETSKMFADLFY